jgi:hypothetical protein
MNMRSSIGVLCLMTVCASGCDLVMDRQTGQLLRQEISKLRGDCDKLGKEVAELTKTTADLHREIALLRQVTSAAPRPSTPVERDISRDKEKVKDRDNAQAVPKDSGLCDIVETHIVAVEGILSQTGAESMESLMDDLEAAFEANLKKYAGNPRTAEIREAAAAMRSSFLAAAKQSHLAMNPYLKNVRQKSVNEGRKSAKLMRSLCEE